MARLLGAVDRPGPVRRERDARTTFEIKRDLDKIGKPVDRTEWGMTPPTVNAYYNPNKNEIVFPAGILQPPFFNANADDAVNYGGIGAVIATKSATALTIRVRSSMRREICATGGRRVSREIQGTRDKIVKQYAEYEPLPGMHMNGKLTLGENIADNGGVKIAYAALKRRSPKIRKRAKKDRRLHAGAALLPGLGAGLARENSRRSIQAAAQNRSAFAGEISL